MLVWHKTVLFSLYPCRFSYVEVEGSDNIFVGRIRRDPMVSHGILLWLVADNLRRGAALDEAEIAERILAL